MLAAAGLHAFWNTLIAGARDTHAVTAVALLAAAAAFAPVAALTWDVDAAAVPFIAASAALELAYFALLAAAYAREDMSVVYPVARGLAPLLLVVAAAAGLGGDVGGLQVAGVALIVVGVTITGGNVTAARFAELLAE